MLSIGSRIKSFRLKKGFTQEQLATALGTTKVAICRYEKDQRQPRYEQLLKIVSILGISFADILEDCGNG